MNLLDALSTTNPDDARVIAAKVTAVASRKLTLSVQGSTVAGIPVADTYLYPRVNDVALVVKVGSAWVAVSALGQAAGAGFSLLTGTSHGPLALLKGTNAAVGAWAELRAHFDSGWGTGGHATIGSRPSDLGFGIMLANVHVPWRGNTDPNERGAFIRHAMDASGSIYWDSGTKGDVYRIARNNDVKFDVYNNGNVKVPGRDLFIGPNATEIQNDNDVNYNFVWHNVRWMQCTALGFSSMSSRDLKEEIRDLPIGLPTLRALKPRRYKFRESGDPTRDRDGLIAEELFEVYPEAVTLDTETGAPKAIDYGALAPVTIRAVQQLDTLHSGTRQRVKALEDAKAAETARADTAEARLTDAEARLAALEARLDAMTTPTPTP